MPTPTDYTYSIATDTALAKCTASRLDLEIRESDIVTALEGIQLDGDVLTVTFKDPLSTTDPEDVANLTEVVEAHEGEMLDSIEPALNDEGQLVTALSGGTTEIGMQAVQVLNLPDQSSDYIRSWQVSAAAGVTEILDIFIGEDLVGATGKCYLAGGEYRCRTHAVEGSALNFSMVDRNDVLGYFIYYGMSRTRLTGLTAFSGGTIASVNVGEYIHGNTSGAKTRVLAKGADYFDIQFHETTFEDGEDLTIKSAAGTPTGVTCTLGSWDEGGAIVIQESLKDEWIEGLDTREILPGGSKEVPEGLYFRVKLYNAETDTEVPDLRVKVSLTVGRL